jgi:hypothetical protein
MTTPESRWHLGRTPERGSSMVESAQSSNAVRFEQHGTNHVESYFLKAVAPDARRALWLKATILSAAADPANARAEAWAIAFDHREPARRQVALKHGVPLTAASFSRHGLGVDWQVSGSADGMHLEPGASRGAISMPATVEPSARRIEWDLRFAGDERPLALFPYAWMLRGPVPASKTVTPSPDLRFTGQVTVGSERWTLDGWRGMQGHNWGRGHAERYAWCHCNQWNDGSELVLEAVSARVRLGPVLGPPLTALVIRLGGVDYPFNRLWQLGATRADLGLRRYGFAARGRHGCVEGLFEAPTDDFVGLYYANPDGPMTYCLNSKLARGWLRAELGGRAPLELRTQAAALELGTRDAKHGVRMFV